ncbi:cobalamin 5'-phosphate synthase [Oceaniovalibus guishaninsula JLT2003]|uniref:Adenosylcobinamide-GDP ribazoletransferase n=1 Tax=Oceaniovalibus guishaninsula JLT2003 TaxID=1231392 RepID=K2HEI0_9RHOB|nr:cobalamin 5'-phosphate synthase [Oceaniovalibus guishaninsula JLT2003]
MAVAIALLTRLPLRADHARGADAAWAWPLAGLVPGLAAGGAILLAGAAGLAPGIGAALALAASVITTGALHEDGLADCADGFWGGFTRDRRLAIMRDSRVGTYGLIALILSLLLRWACLAALIGAGAGIASVLAAALLSRAAMPPVARLLPHARTDGLSVSVRRPGATTALLAVLVALAAALLLTGGAAIPATLAAALAALAVGAVARAKIGGQTGDVLGATQQCAEMAVLLALAAP